MMHASFCKKHGPAEEVFEVGQVPKPTIVDPKQILIENYRTSINPADCKQRSGNLKLVMNHSFPLILGQDFAGVIVGVGSDVTTKFRVGDEVFGSTAPRNGCSAEYVLAYEDEMSKKPKTISWDQAAASPTAYCTAWRGLFDSKLGNLPNYLDNESTSSSSSPPPRVLVIGASGSVGSAAVQLAANVAKANVYAICGSSNKEYVKSLGVKEIFDYKDEDYLKQILTTTSNKNDGFDLILDCVGGDQYYRDLFPFLRRPSARDKDDDDNKSSSSSKISTTWGNYITCVGPVLHGGSDRITLWTLLSTTGILLPRLLLNSILPSRWNPRYRIYLSFTTGNGILDTVAKVLESKIIDCPRIDTKLSPLPLNELGKGHAMVETGHSNGKVIVNTTTIQPTTTEE